MNEIDYFEFEKVDEESEIDQACNHSKCFFHHEEYDGAIFLSDKNSSNNDTISLKEYDSEILNLFVH